MASFWCPWERRWSPTSWVLCSAAMWAGWPGWGRPTCCGWRGTRSAGTATAESDPAYPSFRNGVLVQLTNVKVIIFCLTALSGYVLPYRQSFLWLLGVGLFLPFTGPTANLVWLFAGVSLQKLFSAHRKAVDVVMAVSLALCAVSLVWPH